MVERRTGNEVKPDRSKEIRIGLEKTITRQLKESGFGRLGKSKWVRQPEEDVTQLFYLQRSYLEHLYFLEAGVLDKNTLPKEKRPDITDCRWADRARIEDVIRQVFKLDHPDQDPQAEIDRIRHALRFEVDDTLISPDQVEANLAVIAEVMAKYIPRWFELHPKPVNFKNSS